MRVVRTRREFRAACEELRSKGLDLGLVPTMGALHDGHLSLIAAAARATDAPVVSIFVNPLQFGDPEDLEAYPRDEESDLAKCEDAGVHVVFAPPADEMYPTGKPATVVVPGPLASELEGASRPGHFSGVATVVTKLFSLAGSCRAFFGEKDYQQLVIVRQVTSDLDLPVAVASCPTVREADGLAISSRNRRLSPEERQTATALYQALRVGERAVRRGERSPQAVERAMAEAIRGATLELDYTAVRDPERLSRPERIDGSVRLLVAARVGPVRLIDNLGAAVPTIN